MLQGVRPLLPDHSREGRAHLFRWRPSSRRELRLPYDFFLGSFPWSHMTSPARGGRPHPRPPLRAIPGSRPLSSLRQGTAPRSGPPLSFLPAALVEHRGRQRLTPPRPPSTCSKIRALGQQSWEAASQALPKVQRNHDRARDIANIMRAFDLLDRLLREPRSQPQTEALVYAHSQRPSRQAARTWTSPPTPPKPTEKQRSS